MPKQTGRGDGVVAAAGAWKQVIRIWQDRAKLALDNRAAERNPPAHAGFAWIPPP